VIAFIADVALEVGWRVAGWWQRRSPPPASVESQHRQAALGDQ
jgi:hypothetical protein